MNFVIDYDVFVDEFDGLVCILVGVEIFMCVC